MVIVSHDREFLDQVCTKIVDAEGGLCTEYSGNYSKFLQLKKARMDSWNAAYNAQEKKIKEEKQWINKFRLKQPQAVKQREAQLEKLVKSPDYVQKPPFIGKPFRFRFPDAPRLSPEVAEVKGLTHGYGDGANPLFEDSDLFIEKGDRIAIIGPNGAGKSTLLRILMGKEQPDQGSAEFIGSNVYPAYFEQNQADVLDLDKTVVDTVQAASHGQSYNELRALLGQFLFKGDAVEKKVENLSGGEKARLSLCCMMLKESNLLILDEPTNHLVRSYVCAACVLFDLCVLFFEHYRISNEWIDLHVAIHNRTFQRKKCWKKLYNILMDQSLSYHMIVTSSARSQQQSSPLKIRNLSSMEVITNSTWTRVRLSKKRSKRDTSVEVRGSEVHQLSI